ncbi:MAG: DUF4112 domain-containing protein, partial [Haloplanus sp.]
MSRPPADHEDPTSPVVVDADAHDDVARLRRFSHLFDDAFRVPGTDFRIGLDPLLGLLPVVGDLPGTALAAYAVAVAASADASRATLARMLLVLGVDAVVGSLPLVGDVFDAYWKANLRTVALLDRPLAEAEAEAVDRRYLRRVGVVVFTGSEDVENTREMVVSVVV